MVRSRGFAPTAAVHCDESHDTHQEAWYWAAVMECVTNSAAFMAVKPAACSEDIELS